MSSEWSLYIGTVKSEVEVGSETGQSQGLQQYLKLILQVINRLCQRNIMVIKCPNVQSWNLLNAAN